jgi:hypothetical protein
MSVLGATLDTVGLVLVRGITCAFLIGVAAFVGCLLNADGFSPPHAGPPDAASDAGGGADGSSCSFDLATDPLNCGACGVACRPDQHCHAGKCACRPQWQDCDGGCSNPATDGDHCGTCGQFCGIYQCARGACADRHSACFGGEAGAPCATPGGSVSCVDLARDPANCGACGVRCDGNQLCVGSACVAYAPARCARCGDPACCDAVLSGASTCCPPLGSENHAICVLGSTCQ